MKKKLLNESLDHNICDKEVSIDIVNEIDEIDDENARVFFLKKKICESSININDIKDKSFTFKKDDIINDYFYIYNNDEMIDYSLLEMMKCSVKSEKNNNFFYQPLEVKSSKEMSISVVSFGFKNGIPLEADLVIDVRFLVNPYYEPTLRNKTGLDKEVQDYIENSPESLEFLKKMTDLISYMVPKYIKEGKSYLTIAIGCTGGKHRSVFMAHKLAQDLAAKKFKVSEFHRDIQIVKKEVW